MTITLFTDVPARASSYQPRHRSARWARGGPGYLGQGAQAAGSRCGQGLRNPAAGLAGIVSLPAAPDLLDYLTGAQVRGLLEACATSDYVRAIPEVVHLVAHPSHSAATLTAAWDSFRQATRDAYALRCGSRYWWEFFCPEDLGQVPRAAAVEIKLRLADDAWNLIINGPPWRCDVRPRCDSPA